MARGRQGKRQRGGAGQGRAAAEDFLARNGQRPEVVTSVSGLQSEVIEAGDGPAVQQTSTVTVDQRVKLLNGRVIGDTFSDGRPDTFPLSEAVPGYREGLLGMRCGGRSIFYCPPELAWGRKGAGNKIPPNALLIFDVRLRAVDGRSV